MTAYRTWSTHALSLLALVLYGWGFLGQSRLPALPSGFDVEALSFPVRVDGRTAGGPDELRALVQAHVPGDRVTIRSEDEAASSVDATLIPALTRRHFGITLVSALLFWLVGVMFFARRIGEGAAIDFYLCTLLYGLAVALGGVTYTGPPFLPGFIPSFLQIVCLAALPAIFVHLSLAFPRRHPVLDRRPAVMRTVIALAAAAVALQTIAYVRYFTAPAPDRWRLVDVSLRFGDALMVLEVGAAALLLLHNSRRADLEREQKQARWLLAGFLAGVTPYVFLRTLPGLFGVGSPLPPELDRLFELAIPAAFVLAVARHRLLDIDVIIRRGLIYAALATALTGLYLLFGLSIGRFLTRSFPGASTFVEVLVVILAVALYRPLRRRIGHWIDRAFFRIRYNHTRALRAMNRRLSACSSQAGVAETIHAFLHRTLEPKSAAVLLRSGDGFVTAGAWNGRPPADGLAAALRAAASPRPAAAPHRTSIPECERADFPEDLLRDGFELVQPITAGGRVLGAILVWEKQSERRWVGLDLKLLRSLGARAGKAIERLDLVQSAAAEALERSRLDQLNRMKTDFLSRVSHDLRTPLSSIRWSSENLKDGVAGPLSEPQRAYVEAIRASSLQLGRLVENLLDLSRMELGAQALPLEPIDAARLVRESLTALTPLAAGSEITLSTRLADDLPPIRGHAGKFVEVVTNLVENAVKFAPAGSAIDVALKRGEADRVVLTVRDRGPGVPEAERETIFERFTQGRNAGGTPGRGYGLGLYVVKSTVELFGGTVRVDDHPEGGAIFTCAFPIAEGGPSPA